MKLQAYLDTFKSLPVGIRQAEAHLEIQAQKALTIQNGAVKESEAFEKQALYVRATGQNTGITYTENLDEEPAAVICRAAENGRLVSKSQNVTLTPSGLTYPDHPAGAAAAPTFEEMLAAATALEKKARALCGDAKLADCSLVYTRSTNEVANSLGLAVESECGYYTLEMQLVSQVDGKMGEMKVALLGESLDGFRMEEGIRDAVQIARFQAQPAAFPTGKHDLILSKYTAADFLFILWRSMSAMQNRQSGAAFAGKQGRKLGDSCVNIVSAGSHPACPIRHRMDVEGMPVADVSVMDKGVFKTLMHNRSTAQEAGVLSTGNAGRWISVMGSIPVPVLVAPKVLYVEAGDRSHAELLEQLEDGLVITTILDAYHGIDYSSGEFSVPVMGLIVKEGKVRAATQALVWSGNLIEVLDKVQAVGQDTFFSSYRFMPNSFALGGPDMLIRNQAIASPG